MDAVLTIGYEGSDIDTFISTLRSNDVNVVLDVREFPISRKKGFSKKAFQQALASRGIAYRHEKALGSPKPIREKLYQDRDYPAFFSSYNSHLREQRGLLEQLVQDLNGRVALMCFERDVMTCHRRSVARVLGTMLDKKPKHLVVNDKDLGHGKTPQKTHLHTRQSAPTT